MLNADSHKNRIGTVVAVCFCCFILLMAAVNVKLAFRPALSLLQGELSFDEMTEEIAENYVSAKLWMRKAFINFNGLFARTCGRHAYNDTLLMKNGMLNYGYHTFSDEPDEALEINLAASIKQLSDYLHGLDIPFYFVMAPVKEDLDGELLPEAFHNYQNETGDHLLRLLLDSGVRTLDLRESISENAEESGKYFYRTDHHWNGDGALLGFSILMEYLQNEYSSQLDISFANPELWQRMILKDSFLGTHGKRVGKLYAGTDDLIWYEPVFETDMSLSIPDYTKYYQGSFSEVNIRSEYKERQDLFAITPYVIYVGGDYPSVQHRNVGAPNQKKLLFLKDSFGISTQVFLSTEFSAVDVIDPRYFADAGIADYCTWERPDLVILMMSPSSITNRYYNRVGISEEERKKTEDWIGIDVLTNYTVAAGGPNTVEALEALPLKLENGKSYRISFEVKSSSGQLPDTVSAVLYNKTIENIAQQRIFDSNYYGKMEPWQWTFTVPSNDDSEEFVIYLCTDLLEDRQSSTAEFAGITVTELP